MLSVSKFASDQDIKKAYKRLSKKYHPDKNTEEGAEDRFVKVAHGELSFGYVFAIRNESLCSVRCSLGPDSESAIRFYDIH